MSDVVKRLRYLTSASAEAMSDYERINAFVKAGADACAVIERLEQEDGRWKALYKAVAAKLAESKADSGEIGP